MAAVADLASITQVETAWRPLSGAEAVVATSRLGFASAIVRSQVPDVDARIAAGTLDPAMVAGVVADMVIRVLRNPEAIRQEAVGQWSYTRDASAATGYLFLTEPELRLLQAGQPIGGAYTIVPSMF